jgi:DNA-binding protein HU-beta
MKAKALTLGELSKAVAPVLNTSQTEASLAAEAMFSEITTALKAGRRVMLFGFNFRLKETAARKVRNPRTGEMHIIPAGRKVVVRYTGDL